MTKYFANRRELCDQIYDIALTRADLEFFYGKIADAVYKHVLDWNLPVIPFDGIILPICSDIDQKYTFQLLVDQKNKTYTHETFTVFLEGSHFESYSTNKRLPH